MKIKLIGLSLTVTTNLMALTMDEAVTKALEASHLIKSKTYQVERAEANAELYATAYKPELSTSYQYSRRDFESIMRLKEESLFNGFYDKYTIESQEYLTESEQWLRQSAIADLKQMTQKSYLSLLQAKENQTVQNEAITLLENQLKDMQNFLNQGLIDKSKYLKVKVELQNAKQAQLQANSEVTNAKNSLIRLIQEEVSIDKLEASTLQAKNDKPLETLYQTSLQQRSELKYLDALKASQTANIHAVNSVYYPKIDLGVDYNRYGDEPIPNGVSYGSLGGFKDEVIGRVTISYDLYSGGKESRQKQIHQSQILSISEEIERTKLEIKLQLQQALEQISVTQGQIDVARLSVEEAQEHYRITHNRYTQKLDSTTELLDARLLLTTAQNNLTIAEYNYQKALVDLERIIEKS